MKVIVSCEKAISTTSDVTAVDEGMSLHDVKEVRGGHGEQPVVDEHAVEGRLRPSDGRLEQPAVANAIGATVAGNLECLKLEHVLEVEDVGRFVAHPRLWRAEVGYGASGGLMKAEE